MPDDIAFVWENFGPTHADRCEAVATRFAHRRGVIGVELAGRSLFYEWQSEWRPDFEKITLFPGATIDQIGVLKRVWRTVHACLSASDIFFCHYEHLATFLSACILRLLGRRLYVMSDSKFDDKPRFFLREWGKWLLHLPYRGGIAAGARSADYMRFLGVPAQNIRERYNNVSVSRIRRLAKAPPAPSGASFAERHFTIVARLVPKKNLATAIAALAHYRRTATNPRELVIVGSGPLEAELREKIVQAGVESSVRLTGLLQTESVCEILSHSLALIMPSVEEQFGIAALEAIAMGVPVIVSDNCGVRDGYVRAGINGFVIEPNNVEGLAALMALLAEDEARWRTMATACAEFAEQGDVLGFSESVAALVPAA
jgi:L-malate glycosyltransferase